MRDFGLSLGLGLRPPLFPVLQLARVGLGVALIRKHTLVHYFTEVFWEGGFNFMGKLTPSHWLGVREGGITPNFGSSTTFSSLLDSVCVRAMCKEAGKKQGGALRYKGPGVLSKGVGLRKLRDY